MRNARLAILFKKRNRLSQWTLRESDADNRACEIRAADRIVRTTLHARVDRPDCVMMNDDCKENGSR